MAKLKAPKKLKAQKVIDSALKGLDLTDLNNFEIQKKILDKVTEINPAKYKDFNKHFSKLSIDDVSKQYSIKELNKMINDGSSKFTMKDNNNAITNFVNNIRSSKFEGKNDLETNKSFLYDMFNDFEKANMEKTNVDIHNDVKGRVKDSPLKKETQDILNLDDRFNERIKTKKDARKLEEESVMKPLLEKQKKYDEFYNNVSELEDLKDVIGRDNVTDKKKFSKYRDSVINNKDKSSKQLNDFINEVGTDNLSEAQQAQLSNLKKKVKSANSEFDTLEKYNVKNIEVNNFVGEHSQTLKKDVNEASRKLLEFKKGLGDDILPKDAEKLKSLQGAFDKANDEFQLFNSDKVDYALNKKKDIDAETFIEKDRQKNLNNILKTELKENKTTYKKESKDLRKKEKKLLGGTSDMPKGGFEKGMDIFAHGMAIWGAVSEYNNSRDEGKGVIPSAIRAAGSAAFDELLGGWIPLYYGVKALPKLTFQGIESIAKNQRSLAYQSRRIPFANANFNDHQQAYTMRQAGMELARNSQYNLQQSLLGNEAQYLK